MTEADLARVESELGVSLPAHYREFMLNYPADFLAASFGPAARADTVLLPKATGLAGVAMWLPRAKRRRSIGSLTRGAAPPGWPSSLSAARTVWSRTTARPPWVTLTIWRH